MARILGGSRLTLNPADNDDLFQRMLSPPKASKPQAASSRNRLEPEYEPHFTAWKAAPSPQTNSSMLRAIAPIIDSAVKPLGGSPLLYGQARRIAVQSLAGYDPERASLKTHLMSQLQGLKRLSANQDEIIHVPERQRMQRKHLADTELNLRDSLGRDPDDTELADASGVGVSQIVKLRKLTRPVAESAFGFNDDTDATPGMQSRPNLTLLHSFVRDDMSPTDRLVLDYSTGANGRDKLEPREIARRLSITPGAVSQKLAAVQARLNELDDLSLLGE